ncbi:MAG: DEAD/DEAH box helicase [Nostoc sp. DedSLP03]|uniref:DEAD/DEAH box helicase n=1 Tax=Nostoc sp. DedSLP03 TaxID=3075400 RepID=UPI002AD455FB|nr:DEAD/DEAH box helicase [Nostoc sp. DedSLP03]MDZ7968932.1 DEAD/DEAH box helicase [Nostoc sp. DedSLP03]
MVFKITADVRVSSLLDRLVITPRQSTDYHTLSGVLKDALPGVRIHRSAEGVSIAAQDVNALLNSEVVTDFRWSAEAKLFVENRIRVRQVHQQLYEQVSRIRVGGRDVANNYLTEIEGLDVLDDHQWVNVAAMTIPEGYGLCVFDEQGAGKTVTLIFAFDVLVERDEVDFALIVAPKSMVPEWPRDFLRFKGDLYKIELISGTRKQKRIAIGSGADVLVTNFETAASMEEELRALLRSYQGRAMLVVDESFYIKNLDTKRTQALRRLREWCSRAFVLCGTPAPNAPQDLIQQFNIVDFGITFDGVNIPDDRAEGLPIVQQSIEKRGLFIRHLKTDVLPDLPVKSFNRVFVPLQPEQKRVYAAALRNLILDLRSTDDETFQRQLTSFLARRSALIQICSNPASVVQGYTEIPAKLHALDSILEEFIIRKAEKVILWSFYTASLSAIFTRYSHFYPVRYDGTVSDVAERREAVRKFQEDDETMLFVANPAAAGAGLTLHRARLAIYESMSNQAAHYLQSLDRIHRRGQTRDVEYLILLCDNTIEIEEYERLTRKERAAQALLGDQVEEPITRETMLREAIAASHLLEKEK